MSVAQWFSVNGYDSRKAAETGDFSTDKQSITFTGQVDPASTQVRIYTYRTAKGTNGETEVREYYTTVNASQIKPDGTFTAYGSTEMSGDVRFELQATNAGGNVTVTRIAGKVNGNDQGLEIVSEGEVMSADSLGNWHSYSRNIEIRGRVEPGSTKVSVKVDRDTYTVDDIDAEGNFTLSLTDLNAGQHTITLKSTDPNGNSGKDVYSVSTGQQYGGGAVVIDQNENDSLVKGVGDGTLKGNVLGDYYLEKGGKIPGVQSFSVGGETAEAGETLTIENIGTITVNFDGSYVFTPTNTEYTGRVPDISYRVYNSTDDDDSVLSIRVNHAGGDAYTESLQAADNITGTNEVIQGRLSNDVLIGDERNALSLDVGGETVVYTVKSTNDTIEGNNGDDILFGDNVSTDGLGYSHEGGNAYHALRAYVSEHYGNDTDAAVRSFVSGHWAQLLDDSANGGNDVLRGEAGNDILIGGAGDDTLISGTGKDTYVFVTDSDSGHDTVTDFDTNKDKLAFTKELTADNASWNNETRTLTFTGTAQDNQHYTNTVTFKNLEGNFTLDDVLKAQQVLA